jgi:hypothetical protein
VRQRFIAARVAATTAAGELDDAASIPVMAEMVGDRGVDHSVRAAAFWALARSSHDEAAKPLRARIRGREDDVVGITLTCLGLARLSRDEQRVEDLVLIDRMARESTQPSVRRACTFASAALTPDYRVVRLHPQLHDSDPFVAAIAAWRIGQSEPKRLRSSSIEALFGLYFGPGGLPRDAAIASLARILGEADEATTGIRTPPIPRQRNWNTVVERWLVAHLAPTVDALEPSALEGQQEALLAAWKQSMAGTRAELEAAREAAGACGETVELAKGSKPKRLCLQPLVDGTVELR